MSLHAPAHAAGVEHDRTVSADPVDFTPHVLDGEIFAIAELGDIVVLGGAFTQARNAAAGSPVVARHNLLAFDRSTGEILSSFAPLVDDTVRTLTAGPDGRSVYVGGKFASIDGRTSSARLALLDVRTGRPVAGFAPGLVDGAVFDVKLQDDRLFVGGFFTTFGGVQRSRLAEIDPATAAVRPSLALPLAGVAWSGDTSVAKLDVSPDGNRLVVIGNFRSVGGHGRVQIAMINIAANPATVTSWQTNRYDVECERSVRLEHDIRDVEFSPDGTWFVTVATGGFTAPGSLCDGAARWETAAAGPGQQPTWTAMTGGDSVYSVAVTGTTVYVGGHFRWFNNPVEDANRKGPGAVDREGIAALDPTNGVPLRWNPGRTRGRAVWDMVATYDGLWVGSDTDRIGQYEYHARIAKFPLKGGSPVPQPVPPELPVDVWLASPDAHPDGLVLLAEFDGTTVDATEVLPDETGWSDARGGFIANGALYVAKADGTLMRYRVRGDTFDNPTVVDLHGLARFSRDLRNATSMFYDTGQIFYTLEDSRRLFSRAFSVESDIVGAEREKVPGVAGLKLNRTRGAFLTADGLYQAHAATGTLYQVDWVDGGPVVASRNPVSGPSLDGVDWSARAAFAAGTP